MNIQEQIANYISDQPQPKRDEMNELHQRIIRRSPNCQIRFLDGRNPENKIVSNPNIGYGSTSIKYAGGDTKEFYRLGLSANTGGISLYLMGLEDRKYLAETYGNRLGKAKITGYCIRFVSIDDIDIDVLEEIIQNHLDGGSSPQSQIQA